ncbi:MAG TPA: polysaccharide deacetylase family protein [Propionibacteriaceae bacterium]|nr:polysaccharide deacetylase family protein [Propionibacteriaceae bacterium]
MNPTIPIFLYHSVSDTPTGDFGPYTVSRSQFAAHLDQLLAQGFETLTVRQLVERVRAKVPVPERASVITVDDGFADFEVNAWPELQKRGMSATLYVTAGVIGGRASWLAPLRADQLPMLDRNQLLDLAARDCEIGAHSMSHPQLDCLPHHQAAQEIRQCKDVLEQVLGQSVDSFAYPHGFYDGHVRQLVVDSGYSSASAVRNALSHVNDDQFALSRITVKSNFDEKKVDQVLAGEGFPRPRRRERLRTRGWRQVRRWQYRQRLSGEAA